MTNPTDDQLNALFAEKVAGWTAHRQMILDKHYIARWAAPWIPEWVNMPTLPTEPPKFTDSMDAVLPYLDRHPWAARSARDGQYEACINWPENDCGKSDLGGKVYMSLCRAVGEADTLPRACVIALLRAHGVTFA